MLRNALRFIPENVSYHVMKNDDGNIKECFTHFGCAVYMMQSVEKAVLTTLLNSYTNITKTRYDELMSEKSQMTFGQLKREIESSNLFDSETMIKIENFHTKRDWLAHNYWWDRAIEFHNDKLRYKIIEELEGITSEFENLCNDIDKVQDNFLREKELNMESLIEEFSKLPNAPQVPILRKLSKNETLDNIYLFQYDNEFQILIFKLDDGSLWTLGDRGLTVFSYERQPTKIKKFAKLKDIFPIQQFNPSPKVQEPWNYDLNLKKKGLAIEVRPIQTSDNYVFKFEIKKHSS